MAQYGGLVFSIRTPRQHRDIASPRPLARFTDRPTVIRGIALTLSGIVTATLALTTSGVLQPLGAMADPEDMVKLLHIRQSSRAMAGTIDMAQPRVGIVTVSWLKRCALHHN
jgi:hypothetical protein